jgi:hypothetical protein
MLIARGRSTAPARRPLAAARLASIRPTARVSQPPAVLVTVLVAAIPLTVVIARSGEDLTNATVLLCLTAGASLGWIVDDPAAELLCPLPIDRRFRLGVRLSVAAITAMSVVTAAAVGTLLAGRGLPPGIPDRFPEASTAAAAAVAIGLVATRGDSRAAGAGAVTAGLLLPGVIATLAFRWPQILPTFVTSPVHHRWWWLAVVGAAVALRLANTEPR